MAELILYVGGVKLSFGFARPGFADCEVTISKSSVDSGSWKAKPNFHEPKSGFSSVF